MAHNLRLLIVDGVTGGASSPARARRLSESAEISMFDRGPHVSFDNCGLPYCVGDVIRKKENLLIATLLLRDARSSSIRFYREEHQRRIQDLFAS
jgi:NADPH-dependent 2,4-dienoyl-CoA reductase/sulfur reductase-like enzyme